MQKRCLNFFDKSPGILQETGDNAKQNDTKNDNVWKRHRLIQKKKKREEKIVASQKQEFRDFPELK